MEVNHLRLVELPPVDENNYCTGCRVRVGRSGDCKCKVVIPAVIPTPDKRQAGLRRELWCERNESSASAHGHTADCYQAVAQVPAQEERLDVERLIEDGRKWQAAEAEGHVVTFSETGYGLMHPPSCRPDLIGCWHNQYLASRGYPDEEPGRYRMTRHKGHAEYRALGVESSQNTTKEPDHA